MTDVLAGIKTILADRVGADASSVTVESTLKDDVGIDSVDMVEFVLELEKTFGLEIPDSKGAQLKTVGDVVDLITQLQSSPL